MELRRRWLLLLLLSFLLPSTLAAPEADISASLSNKAYPVGTKDAPVDGKDGMPHEGPFVETSAERDRKRIKENGEEPATRPLTTGLEGEYAGHDVPKTNDGVMDDAERLGPADGTRGTEGGISEKSKDKTDKKPDPPKESRPLPPSERPQMPDEQKEASAVADEDKKSLVKPSDLPEKPHDIPMPENPSSPKLDQAVSGSLRSSHSLDTPATDKNANAVIQPLHSLCLSFMMIIFSEIGDKTFLIAALMAMRHDRLVVFSGAFCALITMTILSAVLGHAVPTLIPKNVTNFLASALFLFFGVKLLLEARHIPSTEGIGAEMKEVEMELEEQEHQQRRMSRRRSSITPYALEAGRAHKVRSTTGRLPSPPDSPRSGDSRDVSPSRSSTFSHMLAGLNNLAALLFSPAWVQTFVMTFLGEWGDRSQIATIAMAAGQDYWWVVAGALVGHAMCTAAAVVGGKAIAGRVSLRAVTMGGAIAFLVFGVIYLYEALY